MADSKRICSVDGCSKRIVARGLCTRHYQQWARGALDIEAKRKRPEDGEPLAWLTEAVKVETDRCIEWPFEICHTGYGTVKHNGMRRPASRVSCEIAHGNPKRDDLEAAHSCHNRACINPRHLRWATRRENCLDMFGDGTAMCGEKVYSAKLTEDDVRAIRRMGGSMSQREIADQFGVNRQQISRILSGKRWGWLDGYSDVHGSS